MAEQNSVSEEIRAQRQKLKGQGFKAHWDYFWEYYKIHTIVAVVALIFLISLIRQIADNKPYALYAMAINCAGFDVQENLQNGFYEYAGINKKELEVTIDCASTFDYSSLDTATVATSEKIMALMAASDLDCVVADKEAFFHFAAQDNFTDLRNVFSAEELESFGDNVLYIDRAYIDYVGSDEYSSYIMSHEYDKENKYAEMAARHDETGEYISIPVDEMEDPVPVGIILEGTTTIEKSGAYYASTPVAGITVNTARLDNAKKFVEYLYQ